MLAVIRNAAPATPGVVRTMTDFARLLHRLAAFNGINVNQLLSTTLQIVEGTERAAARPHETRHYIFTFLMPHLADGLTDFQAPRVSSACVR